MLARRLRRRPNIDPALVQYIVFAGLCLSVWRIIKYSFIAQNLWQYYIKQTKEVDPISA